MGEDKPEEKPIEKDPLIDLSDRIKASNAGQMEELAAEHRGRVVDFALAGQSSATS